MVGERTEVRIHEKFLLNSLRRRCEVRHRFAALCAHSISLFSRVLGSLNFFIEVAISTEARKFAKIPADMTFLEKHASFFTQAARNDALSEATSSNALYGRRLG